MQDETLGEKNQGISCHYILLHLLISFFITGRGFYGDVGTAQG